MWVGKEKIKKKLNFSKTKSFLKSYHLVKNLKIANTNFKLQNSYSIDIIYYIT